MTHYNDAITNLNGHARTLNNLNGTTTTPEAAATNLNTAVLLALTQATLAVADAIRDTSRHAHLEPNERCGAIRPSGNAAHPCILAASHLPITHTDTHIDHSGDMW